MIFVLAVLSTRKTDFEIRSKSNLPSKQTRENYGVTQYYAIPSFRIGIYDITQKLSVPENHTLLDFLGFDIFFWTGIWLKLIDDIKVYGLNGIGLLFAYFIPTMSIYYWIDVGAKMIILVQQSLIYLLIIKHLHYPIL